MTRSFSQKQLCEHFGWNYKNIAQEARAKGMSTHAYIQQKTGWILQDEKYYPPKDRPLENL